MLAARKMTVIFGNTPIINGAGFDLPAGQVSALIGANGAGKSTLMKAVAGLLPTEGDITLRGTALTRQTRQRQIAYMPQDTSPASSLTLTEIVLLGRLGQLGLRVPADVATAAQAMLAQFGLAPLQHRTLAEISGGQRQLALLAQALFRQPQALLLDEPTAALDLRHQLTVLTAIRDFARTAGKPVLLAIHDLALATQFADHLLCLHHGRITAAGPPAEVLTEARIAKIYGVIARVEKDGAGALTVTPLRATEHAAA